MKRNEKMTKVLIYVVMGLIGVSAITCMILSMVTGKTTPYLAMGLGLGVIGNAIGLAVNLNRKGSNNGSGKDRSFS